MVLQLDLISVPEFRPAARIMAEPLSQFGARRQLLEPPIELSSSRDGSSQTRFKIFPTSTGGGCTGCDKGKKKRSAN